MLVTIYPTHNLHYIYLLFCAPFSCNPFLLDIQCGLDQLMHHRAVASSVDHHNHFCTESCLPVTTLQELYSNELWLNMHFHYHPICTRLVYFEPAVNLLTLLTVWQGGIVHSGKLQFLSCQRFLGQIKANASGFLGNRQQPGLNLHL